MLEEDTAWLVFEVNDRAYYQSDVTPALSALPKTIEFIGTVSGVDARFEGRSTVGGIEADPSGLEPEPTPVQARAGDGRATLVAQPRIASSPN